MSPTLELPPSAAATWGRQLVAALDALHLNRHFPPWERVAAHLAALVGGAPLVLDRASALPVPREWIRSRVEAELAASQGRPRPGPAPLDALEVHVALRSQQAGRASYAITVDRLDLVSATVARYSLVVSDRPGRLVTEGELALRPSEELVRRLALLSTQDAALAWAALREEAGLEVEEVVRGVIGPGALCVGDPLLPPGDPGAGPDELRSLRLGAPLLSACLERASATLEGGRVDDPLATELVVPAALFDGRRSASDIPPGRTALIRPSATFPRQAGEGPVRDPRGAFGLSRLRKWAVPAGSEPILQAWLDARKSRGLVSGYPP